MATTPPALGYGTRGAASIDSVNQWLRAQPDYQALLASWGQNPNNVHLNDAQKTAVVRLAQSKGIVVDEGGNGQEVDDSGNFKATSHNLRNGLIVAGIAGAALLTAGAAGAFAGAGGAASAGGGAAALGPSTAANLAATAGIVGGGSVPAGIAAGAGGASTLGGLAGVGKFFSSPAGASIAGTFGNVFSNIYGANKQADANSHAAELADEATKRAEVFSREQAETGWQSNEHTQHANYDQWRARQNAIMGSLGQQLGINYTPPEYSAGVDPHYTGAGAPPPGAALSGQASAPSGIDWTKPADQLSSDLSAFFKSKGVSDHETPYWVKEAPNLVARGQEIGDPDYANKRLAAAEVLGGGTPASAAPAPRQTLATFVSPKFLPYQTSTPLPTPYQPGTLGAYLGSA